MSGAGVALDGGDAVRKIGRVFGRVGFASGASSFFIHPGDDTGGADGAQMEALQNFGGFHGDDDSGAVIDGGGAEVPGIEVAGDDHDLLRMFRAFEIGDDVVADFVG